MFSSASKESKVAVPPHRLRSFRKTRKISAKELKNRDTTVAAYTASVRSSSSSSSSSSLSSSSSDAAIYSYLIDPKVVYTFRLVNLYTITASVNVIAGYQNLDPTGLNEWGSLTNLFSVYRVKGARLTIVPTNSGSTSTTNGRPWLIVSPEVGQQSVTPSNGQAAMDGAASRMISLLPGMPHKDYQFDFPNGILPVSWQLMASSQYPYAGSWGEFAYYGQTAGASDSYQTVIEMIIECSGRT